MSGRRLRLHAILVFGTGSIVAHFPTRSSKSLPSSLRPRRCLPKLHHHGHPGRSSCLRPTGTGTETSTPTSTAPTNDARRVCGYVFKRGDIAWNCRKCQVDSTCVQCDACFRRSDHVGHPVREGTVPARQKVSGLPLPFFVLFAEHFVLSRSSCF